MFFQFASIPLWQLKNIQQFLLSFFYKAIKNCPSKIRGSQDTFQIQCLSPRSWNIRVLGRKRICKFLLNFHYHNVRTLFAATFLAQIDQLLLQDKRLSRISPWIRKNDVAWQFCMDPQFMVEEAFLQVTDEQIRNYIRHAEYLW